MRVRLDANGGLDGTFGTGGVLTIPGATAYQLTSVAIQADGSLIAAGNTSTDGEAIVVIRVTSTGSMDPTFGNSGVASTQFGGSLGDREPKVLVQGDGKVVVAGRADYDDYWGITRFLADGTLDTSFNGTGHLTETFDGGFHFLDQAFHEQAQGLGHQVAAAIFFGDGGGGKEGQN